MWTPATAVVGELTATWRDGAEDTAEPVQPDPSLLGISAEYQGPLLPDGCQLVKSFSV